MGQISITPHETYLEYCFHGTFDDETLFEALHELWIEFTPPQNPELYDLREADFIEVTTAGVQKTISLNRLLRSDSPKVPVALLANYDLNHFYSHLVSSQTPNVRAFLVNDEAVAWVSSEGAHSS